jgi:hypothetical protein
MGNDGRWHERGDKKLMPRLPFTAILDLGSIGACDQYMLDFDR